MDARLIGRRIGYWRDRRRLTQADFGALMGGRTARWVQMLESGARQADPRLSVPENSARVLRIPLEWLLRDGPEAPSVDAVELEAIRAVRQRYDVIPPRPPRRRARAGPGPRQRPASAASPHR
ncbi:hypothetical protein ACE1SV_73850 [Streptomyces sp. E-15]